MKNGNEVKIRRNRKMWKIKKRECNQDVFSFRGPVLKSPGKTVNPIGAFKSNAHTCCCVV